LKLWAISDFKPFGFAPNEDVKGRPNAGIATEYTDWDSILICPTSIVGQRGVSWSLLNLVPQALLEPHGNHVDQ
jgi:hypothetical protein